MRRKTHLDNGFDQLLESAKLSVITYICVRRKTHLDHSVKYVFESD